eukprot:s1559_g4.t1
MRLVCASAMCSLVAYCAIVAWAFLIRAFGPTSLSPSAELDRSQSMMTAPWNCIIMGFIVVFPGRYSCRQFCLLTMLALRPINVPIDDTTFILTPPGDSDSDSSSSSETSETSSSHWGHGDANAIDTARLREYLSYLGGA